MMALRLLLLSTIVAGFAPRIAPQTHKTMRYAVEEMYLCDENVEKVLKGCLLYTSPSPRDRTRSRMPSSA